MYEVFTRLCATAEVGAVVLDDFRVASGFERCQAFYTAAFQLGIDPLSFDIGLDGIGVVEPIDSDDSSDFSETDSNLNLSSNINIIGLAINMDE